MKTCRIQIRTTCKPRDALHLSGKSSEGGKKFKNKSTSTWTGTLIFRKSNKGPQMSQTRKHTHAPHLWPCFLSVECQVLVGGTEPHHRQMFMGNGNQMAAHHLPFFFSFFLWALPHMCTCQTRPSRMLSQSMAAKMATAFCLQISLSSSVHGERAE